jgi:hypothetical protein
MKAYGGMDVTDPHFLELGTSWVDMKTRLIYIECETMD